MYFEDTIAAIATPAGQSGISIVRLSGIRSIAIADDLFRSAQKKSLLTTPSHRILYGHIIDPSTDEVIDEVLLSIMRAPRTYTREEMVEINCHGGIVPVRRVLELLLRSGARLAEPGEFTKRAFLNGRIDLAQAEAVLDVINALTVQSQKAAFTQLSGSFSSRISAIRDDLVALTARVEVCIDFPEEEIGELSLKDMEDRSHAIGHAVKELIESARYGMILREGLNTAIIGRPNVGKSSLLNALLEQEKAIVTDMPGTTRDIIEEYINIEGVPLRIMDTAGIREVSNHAEKEGVRRSLALMQDADLILLILDGSEPLHDTDRELLRQSESRQRIVVINKADLPAGVTQVIPEAVHISAKKSEGLDHLKKAIMNRITAGSIAQGADIVTNVRHLHALEKAYSSLLSFQAAAAKNTPPEFLALELRDGLDAVGEILGMTTPDDILNTIFSSFCIGK